MLSRDESSQQKSEGGESHEKTDSQEGSVLEYNIGTIVLGKIGGYLTWPGWIVHPRTASCSTGRKVRGKQNYCIQFFPSGNYAWHTKDDMKALRREEIETYIVDSQKTFYYWSGHQVKKPHQQMGDFVAGCCAALNPEKWIETHASTAAEGELSPEKARGQGDSDAYSNKKRLKKRKRGSDNGTKPELEAGGRGGIVEEVVLQSLAKKQRYKPQTQTDDGGTAAANGMTQSEEEPKTEDDKLAGTTVLTTDTKTDSRSSKIPRDPEAFAVWFWRNRLQRVLCSNTLPKSEDMPLLDMPFTKIEVYEEMNVECLRSSRIQKVMHSIAKLPDQKAPRDGEFQFRARALALVQKWQVMLDNSDAEKDRTA